MILEDVRGREMVGRLGVLRLDVLLLGLRLGVIDLERLVAGVRVVILLLELRLDTLRLELRLDVIELERLGVELRVDVLGALLRLETLGALDRFELLDRVAEPAALRLLLLLLELPLFREVLAAQTGSVTNAKIKMQNAKNKEIIPARRDSTILIFDL